MIAALLAAVPLLVHAQQLPLCNINRDLATCRLAAGRNCPGGCFRASDCPKTTFTTTKTTTKLNTVTATPSASTITITGSGSTGTVAITATDSASTITVNATITVNSTETVTASTSSSAPPSCKTEVPYANLFAFPDWECKSETGLIQNLEANYSGLVGPQIKFNTLIFNNVTNYNESACIDLLPAMNGARSVYYTIDGYPKERSFPDCSMNLYNGRQCSGNPESSYFYGGTDSCKAMVRTRGLGGLFSSSVIIEGHARRLRFSWGCVHRRKRPWVGQRVLRGLAEEVSASMEWFPSSLDFEWWLAHGNHGWWCLTGWMRANSTKRENVDKFYMQDISTYLIFMCASLLVLL
jgi:hypothetical protein